ncbi:unnamed protein product [Darwinula stevensoni]|uniref:Cullin family profile domain-containing protein n=1 Tax=Darwinula stevensoni TaxID=69355 RepID=A0A7R8XBM0_9CRUS|nr:unnamed protein product [Darwinula stevensoni]CAG0892523.1 unnamed protein product [Darwinula stevensoni]
MVLNRQGRKLYAGLRRVVARHLEEEVREDLLESPPSDFLQTLTLTWTDHKISLVIMRDILSYMERVYVPQHGVEDVYGLGLVLFRDHVIKYREIKEQLKEALSDMVAKERRGETVDRSMIRDITTMLAMLGGDIYKRVFEDPFLQQAVEFYRVKSRNFLEEGSSVREESRTNVEKEGAIQEAEDESRCDHMATIVEEENQKPPLESTASDIQPFIRHVRAWTEREARRASRYGVGKRALRRAMTDALILDNMDAIVAATVAPKPPSFPALQRESPEIARMLRDGSAEELRSRYDLHSSVPEGSNITAKCVSAYLRERGRALAAEAEGPVSHVQSLLDLKHQLDGILHSSFRGDRVVEQAIARDFHHLLGLDPRSAERLSLFVDHTMKRGARGMTEPEIGDVLDGAMALFRFLPEKDAFQRFYEKHLAERLLLESASEEVERSMVSRLKTECGSQFTAKLEGMLKDMAVSKAIAKELKHRVAAAGVSASQSNLFTVALWGIASVDGVVLRAGRSAGEIATETHIPERDLIRALQSLTLGKATQRILTKNPKTRDIEPNDVFAINDSFTSKLYRVEIHSTKGKSVHKRIETRSQADEDGEQGIEATNMHHESCKRQPHNPLTTEVPEQLKGRLLPRPVVLEKRI